MIRRPRRLPATPASVPGPVPRWLRGLWLRLHALLSVTPEQWHAHELARRACPGGDGLRGGVTLSGGQIALMSLSSPTSLRRSPQPDLP